MVKALDTFSRLCIGQINYAVEAAWAHKGFDMDKGKIDSLCNQIKGMLTGMASPGASYGIHSKEIPDGARIAWDIQQVIRHQLAWDRHPEGGMGVSFDKPMQSSEQPLPLIERKVKNE